LPLFEEEKAEHSEAIPPLGHAQIPKSSRFGKPRRAISLRFAQDCCIKAASDDAKARDAETRGGLK